MHGTFDSWLIRRVSVSCGPAREGSVSTVPLQKTGRAPHCSRHKARAALSPNLNLIRLKFELERMSYRPDRRWPAILADAAVHRVPGCRLFCAEVSYESYE